MRTLTLILLILAATSCTDNARARRFGGQETIQLPAGQRLVNVTWKETQIWYLTVPMDSAWVPQRYEFHEKSQYGLIEGTVALQETR